MYQNAEAVTPSDTTILRTSRALWVESTGTLKVDTVGGSTAVTFTIATALSAVLPIQATRVYATGTSTTLTIINLY